MKTSVLDLGVISQPRGDFMFRDIGAKLIQVNLGILSCVKYHDCYGDRLIENVGHLLVRTVWKSMYRFDEIFSRASGSRRPLPVLATGVQKL